MKLFHIHQWSKWTAPFQRYDLHWQKSRRCRTCGERRIVLI